MPECVEIKADELPPNSVNFIDEEGKDCTQEVVYECMPTQCLKCKTFRYFCEILQDKNAPVMRTSPPAAGKKQPQGGRPINTNRMQSTKGVDAVPYKNHKEDKGKAKVVGEEQAALNASKDFTSAHSMDGNTSKLQNPNRNGSGKVSSTQILSILPSPIKFSPIQGNMMRNVRM